MDAVVAFIANGEATKPGERALDDPAEHAHAAAVGRAATARTASAQKVLERLHEQALPGR